MQLKYLEIDNEEKRRFTKNSAYYSYDGGPLYEVTNEHNNILGHIQIKDNYICMIETYGQSRGVGTQIVEHFLEKNGTLTGNAKLDAVLFWIKMGATFSDYDKGEILKYLQLSEDERLMQEDEWNDYYPAFTLNK